MDPVVLASEPDGPFEDAALRASGEWRDQVPSQRIEEAREVRVVIRSALGQWRAGEEAAGSGLIVQRRQESW